MDLRLKDQTICITGAGSGIGQAIAKYLGKEGAVIKVLDIDEQGGAHTAEAIRNTGGKAEFHKLDVSDYREVNAFFSNLERIDVLVNNAGISSIGNVETATPEEMDRIYSINVKGVYHCLHAAIPLMKEQGKGTILNMASIAGKLGIEDRFAYSMSKGAVLSMTLSVARDYVSQGVRCNCICPARVHTPFVDAYLDRHYSENREEMFQKLSAYQPIGRMGKPEDIATLAAFLCSDASSFITGSAYDIDGGVTLLR